MTQALAAAKRKVGRI